MQTACARAGEVLVGAALDNLRAVTLKRLETESEAGDAETRIREDGLRILRFFRFLAWYGQGEPDAEGLAACERMKGGLISLSAERIAKELLQLLAAEDPRPALRLMAATGILSLVAPEAHGTARFERLVEIESDLFQADALLRLRTIAPGAGKPLGPTPLAARRR